MILNSPYISGSLTVTGNIVASGSITLSGSVASASFAANAATASFVTLAQTASFVTTAQTASFVANAQSASNAVVAQTASYANTFTVAGNLTAQTLVVQTITSSVDFVTGSTKFGSIISNTHQFTGSMSVSGSLTTNGAVGIGTSSPTSGYSLDVNGTSYFRSTTVITGSGNTYLNIRTISSSSDAAVFMFDGTNTGYVGLNAGTNPNKFVIYYGAATRMSIDATTGNVGFGTGSASYNLEVSSGSASPTELAITNTNVSGAARLSLRNAERNFILTSNTTDDLLSFSYDGSNRLQFNTINQWFNSGNLGIGTNAPGFTLHTMSTGATVASLATTSATGGYTSYRYNTSTTYGYIGNGNQIVIGGAVTDMALTVESGNLLFATTAGTERMRIASGGNVGIGKTNPGKLLDMAGDAFAGIGIYDGTNTAVLQWHSSDGFRMVTTTAKPLVFFTNDTEKMRITSGGNVGVGTTNPSSLLHVSSSVGGRVLRIDGPSTADNYISCHSGGIEMFLDADQTNSSGIVGTQSNHNMILRTNGTNKVWVTTAGRVGIGVTNPDAGLQVAQPGNDDQLTLGSSANNRDHAAFIYSGGNKAEFLRYQSGVRLVIGSSTNIQYTDVVPGGSVGVRLNAGNTSWSAYTSDERKKKNFETAPGLEAVMQINPVKYHFKTQEDSETKKLGFIAQNIQPLIPEMVHPNGEKAEDGSDILTIIPDYILPVLVKAIQELKAQNDDLQSQINELKA